MTETFRYEFVRCCKPNCGRCPHGPYWYAYWREQGKLRKRYIGLFLPKEEPVAPRDELLQKWELMLSKGTANAALAREILRMGRHDGADKLKSAYRAASLKHHPDRGGSQRHMMCVNAAYGYLKSLLT